MTEVKATILLRDIMFSHILNENRTRKIVPKYVLTHSIIAYEG